MSKQKKQSLKVGKVGSAKKAAERLKKIITQTTPNELFEIVEEYFESQKNHNNTTTKSRKIARSHAGDLGL
jgi:hypothetical protein